MAATIEHVIPRRENGPNTAGNVRLAHRACNNALGALWQINQDRAKRGLPSMSANWALTNERGKLHVRGQAPPTRPRYVKRQPIPTNSLAGLIARGDGPLPRGATLPKQAILAPVYEHSLNKPARRMTALETARWLRENAAKRGKPWPLA